MSTVVLTLRQIVLARCGKVTPSARLEEQDYDLMGDIIQVRPARLSGVASR